MIKTLFDRFLIDIKWSTDRSLWYTDSAKDNCRYHHLISLMKVDRTTDGKTYEALQLIIGKLSVVVADAGKGRSGKFVETKEKTLHEPG